MHSVVPNVTVGGTDGEEGGKRSGRENFVVHRMNRY